LAGTWTTHHLSLLSQPPVFPVSNNVRFWEDPKLLRVPKFYWELMQIGNCGSPMETKEGWLLLTHGVGPMRQSCVRQVQQKEIVPTQARRGLIYKSRSL